MKNNKIIIALNNYNLPNPTAHYGIQLAKKLDQPAYLYGVEKVPVVPEPLSITGTGVANHRVMRIGIVKKVAEKQIEILHQEFSQIHDEIKYDIEIGFPETALIEKTEKDNPYLVVIEGNNELTTLHEWFGTYETRLAENIEAPVLVLPSEYKWKSINRIVYVMDIDDQKVTNMRFLTNIAEELKANIAVVLLSSERNEKEMEKYNQIVRTMRTLLGYSDVTFHQFFTQDSAETIDSLLNHVRADWLAFEHENHSFLERMLDNYNTKRLILQSEIPVLVF